jgi:WD40 repeat protein
VAFSPDGALLAAGGDDDVARVWSPQTGQELYVIRVSAAVLTLAFNPDGRSLLVSTTDGTFYSVDTATGKTTKIGIGG